MQTAYDAPSSRRGTLTVTTAAVLTGLYGLYAFAITPLIDAPQVSRAARPTAQGPPPPPPENVRMAGQHLPAQGWAADAHYQFRSGGAFIYANQWEPVDDDRAIRFEPFAMVWRQDDKQRQEPLTIVSESAYLKFAGSFDLPAPDPGRVIGGKLEGDVRITGPDGLLIEGRNFEFSEDALRIWSDNQLQFAFGPHRGRAQGVQIELARSEESSDESSLAIGGIKSLRLRGTVSMDLLFEGGESEVASETPPDEPVRVRILSAGSFEYVVDTHIATFEDNVRVYRPTEPGKFDSLQCDLLTLLFAPQEPTPGAATAGNDAASRGTLVETSLEAALASDSASEGDKSDDDDPFRLPRDLTFRRLRAQGQNVTLISETNELTAQLTELIYDAQSKVAALTDAEMVRVQQGPSELHAPEIRLLHDDDGEITTAVCQGAGRLTFVDRKTGQLQLAAEWVKQLRKFPDTQSEFDIIELEEQATVRQPEEQVGLTANYIRLWVDRINSSSRPKQDEPKPVDASFPGDEDRVRVRHMLALDDVNLVSPQMHGGTKRLEIWFEQAPAAVQIGGNTRETLQPAVHRVAQRPAPAGEMIDSSAGRARVKPQQPPPEPIQVVAEQIRVRVRQGQTQRDAHVAEVWTDGQVRVTQDHEPGEPPLEMTGDQLHVQNRSEQDQVLHLTGNPAHIRDRGLHIEGRNVHLDRGRNLAWVEGAGLLQMPVESTLEGKKLDTPQVLDVWWKEQMRFDGKMAEFFGDVRSVLADSRMRCQEMNVTLAQPLSFSEPNRDQQTEIDGVVCRDGVEFDSYEYVNNKLMSVRRGHFAQFSLNRQTGKTDAAGPGWLLNWKRGTGRRAGFSPTASVQANQPLKQDAAAWEYTRVDFAGRTDGNIDDRQMTFHDRVRIVYGPVERPQATIDADELPKDAGWMSCQSLRVTQHPATDTSKAYSELLASGNAELEGQSAHGSFNARADEITFDESKGLYILRAGGSRKASIWRQKQTGGDMSRIDAQRMEFIPSTKDLKFDRATGLDAIN